MRLLLIGVALGAAAAIAALVDVRYGEGYGDREYDYVALELRDWRIQFDWGRR